MEEEQIRVPAYDIPIEPKKDPAFLKEEIELLMAKENELSELFYMQIKKKYREYSSIKESVDPDFEKKVFLYLSRDEYFEETTKLIKSIIKHLSTHRDPFIMEMIEKSLFFGLDADTDIVRSYYTKQQLITICGLKPSINDICSMLSEYGKIYREHINTHQQEYHSLVDILLSSTKKIAISDPIKYSFACRVIGIVEYYLSTIPPSHEKNHRAMIIKHLKSVIMNHSRTEGEDSMKRDVAIIQERKQNQVLDLYINSMDPYYSYSRSNPDEEITQDTINYFGMYSGFREMDNLCSNNEHNE